jgi:hypothetical protein
MPEPLPNADQARIDSRKLRDYALNPEHITGRFKAAFFTQMGYHAADWEQLERDIREQHLGQPAEPGQPTPYGIKYAITAPLKGPHGAARHVTTVWILRPGEDRVDLVTIEPAVRRKAT